MVHEFIVVNAGRKEEVAGRLDAVRQ